MLGGWHWAWGLLSSSPPLMRSCSLRWDMLHQGLFLGFGKLRSVADPSIASVWNDASLPVTSFDGDDAGGNTVKGMDSLFNLGMRLVAAGREVAFLGEASTDRNLTTLPSARFLHANGPYVAYPAYARSLNLMVRRDQGHSTPC